MDGAYPPGTLLSENELAATLGVSRTPVRSALGKLRDDGWITIHPQRGAVVNSLTMQEIRDIANARFTLEISGVNRTDAARRRVLADGLEPLVARQREALEGGRVREFVELAVGFHRAFVEAGRNPYLIDLGRRLADRQRQLLFAQEDRLLARAPHIIEEHAQLLADLREDDVATFAETLRTHLLETYGPVLGPV